MIPRRRVVRGHPNVYFKPKTQADEKPAPPYEIGYYDSNRKRTFKGGFASLEAAEMKLAEVQVDKGRGVPVVNSKATFREYAEAEMALRKIKPQTLRSYEQLLRDHAYPVFGDRKLTDIGRPHMRRMVEAKLQPNTMKGLISVVGSIFKSAVADGIIGVNPVDRLARHERPRGAAKAINPFQPNEIEKLLANAKDLRPVFETGIFAGLRAGELYGLTWRRVDLSEGVIHVREQWLESEKQFAPPKTHAGERDIYIDGPLLRTLKAHKLASPHCADDDFVFAQANGRPLTHSNIRYRLKTACRRAGLVERAPHQMRHTFATLLIDSGCPGPVVQKQMGHESVKTTYDTYTHWWNKQETPERVREALARARAAIG